MKNFLFVLIFNFQFLIFSAISIGGPAFGGNSLLFAGVGTQEMKFLRIVPGARTAALGEIGTAFLNGNYSLTTNPALLSGINRNEISFTHIEYFADVNYEFLGFAISLGHQLKKKIGLAGNLVYLDAGKWDERDLEGVKTGKTLSYQAGAFCLGGGIEIDKDTSFGLNGIFAYDKINKSAQYFGATIGALYGLPLGNNKLQVGFAAQNLGRNNSLPTTFALGTTYEFQNLATTISLDSILPVNENFYLNLGIEKKVKSLFLRAGLNRIGRKEMRYSIGLGLFTSTFSFDYAYVPFQDLADTHRISFTIHH